MSADTEIVTVEPEIRLGILPARTPHDVIVQASAIAKELAKIVRENRLSVTLQNREYVKAEGWSTMGAMLGVLPREVTELTRRFDDGAYEATVELIRITDGAVVGRASAFVGMDEKDRQGRLTWGSRAEYARRSMAVTRAMGKAYRLGFSWIIGLAGFEPTPAEEMGDVMEGEYKVTQPTPVQPSTPAPKPGNGGSFNPVQCLIDNKIAANDHNARALLDGYVPATVKTNAADLIAWGKLYRAWRDKGKEPEEAAQKATAKVAQNASAEYADDVNAGIDPRDGMPFGDK
jgi:hypothetical protein